MAPVPTGNRGASLPPAASSLEPLGRAGVVSGNHLGLGAGAFRGPLGATQVETGLPESAIAMRMAPLVGLDHPTVMADPGRAL